LSTDNLETSIYVEINRDTMLANLRISAFALFFLSQVVGTTEATDDCASIDLVGTPSWEKHDVNVTMTLVDDVYTLRVDFTHDEELPIPTNFSTQCDKDLGEIASDGLKYTEGRWSYETVSERITRVTGIKHISIDFNPCGHPPADVFAATHYDVHFYRISPEYRTCMQCITFPGAPLCNFIPDGQAGSESGQAFFEGDLVDGTDQPKNMPAGYQLLPQNGVNLMGLHAWNPDVTPDSPQAWTEPVWIMGNYARDPLFYEPMIPYVFMSGSSDNEFEATKTYEGQTYKELPYNTKFKYDGTTGVTSVILEGESKIDCENKEDPFNIELNGATRQRDCDWLASKKKKQRRRLCKETVVPKDRKFPGIKLHKCCKETCGLVGKGKCAFLKDL